MARARRHVHKYHKRMVAYVEVWACALPDCTHHMPKHMESMVEGKLSYCWSCGEIFPLDDDALKMEKPFCIHCRTGVPRTIEISEAPMDEKLKELLARLDTDKKIQ